MPLTGCALVKIDRPLLQLAIFANLIGDKPRARRVELARELFVDPQFFRRVDAVGKQFTDEGHIHRASGTCHGGLAVRRHEIVLRRERRTSRQMPFPILDQPRQTKLRRALHQRIRTRTQKFLVAREPVMLIQMCAEPGPAHAPIGPRWLRQRPSQPDWPRATGRYCGASPSLASHRSRAPRARRFWLRSSMRSNSGSVQSLRLHVSAGQ